MQAVISSSRGQIDQLAARVQVNVLDGPPGTGKTTELSRLVSQANDAGWAVLVASLTRAAAREVAGRDLPIDPKRIGTLHAHAYHALDGPTIAESKLVEWNDWLEKHGAPPDWRVPPSYGKKPRLNEPNDVGSGEDETGARTRGVELLEACGVARAQLRPVESWLSVEQREFYGRWRDWKRESGYLDFQDLIETCLEQGIRPAVDYAALYLDEAQDMSRAEMALALSWAEGARAIVVVGDPHQNLYEWRGSEPDVLALLWQHATRRRVLEQSYRVPRAVHSAAVAWIAQLEQGFDAEYRPRDADGLLEYSPLSLGRSALLVNEIECDLANGQSVMVLASCAYMLDELIGELRTRALPFHNPYRTHNGRWNPLLQAYKPTSTAGRVVAFTRVDEAIWGDDSRLWTPDELAGWADLVEAKVFSKKADLTSLKGADFEVSAQWLADRVPDVSDLEAIFDGNLDWLEDHVLPSKARAASFPLAVARERGPAALLETPRLVIGTIHSVKGGEADRVYLFPDLSPAGYEEWLSPEYRDRVRRLFYVGMTRAREDLILCSPSTSRSVEW